MQSVKAKIYHSTGNVFKPKLEAIAVFPEGEGNVNLVNTGFYLEAEVGTLHPEAKNFTFSRLHDMDHFNNLEERIFIPILRPYYRYRNLASLLSEWLAIFMSLLVYVLSYYFKVHYNIILATTAEEAQDYLYE